ncbi:MAG: PAS domain S-box protein [Chloroflexi bacterium]|nr:PAS domain S-box protein [Chloroflexota bacterium]
MPVGSTENSRPTIQGVAPSEVGSLRFAVQPGPRRVQHYWTAVEQTPISIALFDPQTYRFVDTNAAFQQLLGYSADEMLALALDDLVAIPRPLMLYELQQVRQSGKASVQELRYQRKNRQLIDVEVSTSYQYDEAGGVFCLIVHDISRHKQAEEMIRYQANLVQSVSDAIISTDMNFCIESWNRAATELYGMAAAEVIGKPFGQVLRVQYPGTDRIALLQRLERDGAWQGEQIHHHKDGTRIDILASVSYVWNSQGQHVGIVGVNRNITERKRVERLLLLAQKSEHINLLASGIAHDFNNMLTSVLSQTSLALRKLPADTNARAHLEKAIKSTELMVDLTRQLRAYTGQSDFQIEAVDLNQLVKDNLGLLEAFLPKQSRLEFSLMSDLPTIEIDRGQAQQLVMNLVINAAEAIQCETGRIIVETGQLFVDQAHIETYKGGEWLTPGRHIYLKIMDNGVGMDHATLAHIFEPYFTTKSRGSGLGLAATLGIVQKIRGAIKVESRSGQGSTFVVLFPVGEPEHATPVEIVPTPGDTVLVIDDESSVREVVGDILATEGIKVILAVGGRDGLEKFKRHKAEINLVLLDLKMPVMNGEETFLALRAIDPNLKIVLSSGYSEQDVTKRLLQQPLTQFLPKPYSTKALVAIIRDTMQQ